MKRSIGLLSAGVISAGLIYFSTARNADATAAIMFLNSDSFDGDVAGGTAGPFLDSASSVSGTITTTGVVPGGSLVNTTSGQLGVNAPGTLDTADSFDNGESWSFKWDVDSQFAGIDFGNYSTTTENLAFSVQSSAWIGLGIIPGSTNVIFSSATGAFTFKDGTASDIFTATDLYDGGTVPTVLAGTDILISYTAGSTDNAVIQGMSFNLTAVPEPGSVMLLSLGGILIAGYSKLRIKLGW
jgi:hypothetical protein